MRASTCLRIVMGWRTEGALASPVGTGSSLAVSYVFPEPYRESPVRTGSYVFPEPLRESPVRTGSYLFPEPYRESPVRTGSYLAVRAGSYR